MKKDPKVFIEHILESIHHIEIYIDKMSKENFLISVFIQDAVIRRLEIIEESINKIPLEFREEYPDISWCQIAGMIDVLIHEYFDVNLDLTWNVVKNDLPELEQKVEIILKKLDEPSTQVSHKDYISPSSQVSYEDYIPPPPKKLYEEFVPHRPRDDEIDPRNDLSDRSLLVDKTTRNGPSEDMGFDPIVFKSHRLNIRDTKRFLIQYKPYIPEMLDMGLEKWLESYPIAYVFPVTSNNLLKIGEVLRQYIVPKSDVAKLKENEARIFISFSISTLLRSGYQAAIQEYDWERGHRRVHNEFHDLDLEEYRLSTLREVERLIEIIFQFDW